MGEKLKRASVIFRIISKNHTYIELESQKEDKERWREGGLGGKSLRLQHILQKFWSIFKLQSPLEEPCNPQEGGCARSSSQSVISGSSLGKVVLAQMPQGVQRAAAQATGNHASQSRSELLMSMVATVHPGIMETCAPFWWSLLANGHCSSRS